MKDWIQFIYIWWMFFFLWIEVSKRNAVWGCMRSDTRNCTIMALPLLDPEVLKDTLHYGSRLDGLTITPPGAIPSSGYQNCLNTVVNVDSIVAGEDASEKEWPWQVLIISDLVNGTYSEVCGGVLLNKYWILTAAHCLITEQFVVITGAVDLLKVEHTDFHFSSIVITHKDYVNIKPHESSLNDIGLIKLESPVSFSSRVFPACLPTADLGDFTENDGCYITGFGTTFQENISDTYTPMTLQQAKTDVLNNSDCKRIMHNTILDSHLCIHDRSGTSSACFGDSGGPLNCMVDGVYYVAGLTSYGDEFCTPGSPNIYTRVSFFTEWIQEAMKAYS